MKQKFGTLSVVLTALTLPVSLFVSSVLSFWLKRANTKHVDITNGLAYLRPVLISGIVTFLVLFILSVAMAVIGLKKDEDKKLAKRSLLLIVVVAAISLSAAGLQNRTNKVEESYKQKQLKTFFQQLSK